MVQFSRPVPARGTRYDVDVWFEYFALPSPPPAGRGLGRAEVRQTDSEERHRPDCATAFGGGGRLLDVIVSGRWGIVAVVRWVTAKARKRGLWVAGGGGGAPGGIAGVRTGLGVQEVVVCIACPEALGKRSVVGGWGGLGRRKGPKTTGESPGRRRMHAFLRHVRG